MFQSEKSMTFIMLLIPLVWALSGVSAKYQRMITKEIKKARILALLPFVVDPRQN